MLMTTIGSGDVLHVSVALTLSAGSIIGVVEQELRRYLGRNVAEPPLSKI